MRVWKNILIFVAVLFAVACIGTFLFHHFVTNRVMDRDGMENPDAQITETLNEEIGTEEME